jgi:hypothetical protein
MRARNPAWLAAAALVISSLLPGYAPAQTALIRFVVGTVAGGAIDRTRG